MTCENCGNPESEVEEITITNRDGKEFDIPMNLCKDCMNDLRLNGTFSKGKYKGV